MANVRDTNINYVWGIFPSADRLPACLPALLIHFIQYDIMGISILAGFFLFCSRSLRHYLSKRKKWALVGNGCGVGRWHYVCCLHSERGILLPSPPAPSHRHPHTLNQPAGHCITWGVTRLTANSVYGCCWPWLPIERSICFGFNSNLMVEGIDNWGLLFLYISMASAMISGVNIIKQHNHILNGMEWNRNGVTCIAKPIVIPFCST